MKILVSDTNVSEIKGATVVFPIFLDAHNLVNETTQNELVKLFLADNPKFGKNYETQLVLTSDNKYLLVGLGKKDQLDNLKIQNYIGTGVRHFLAKTEKILIVLPETELKSADVGKFAAIGALIASDDPIKQFKSEKEEVLLQEVTLVTTLPKDEIELGITAGKILGKSINLAREISDLPPNIVTPTYVVNQARTLVKELPQVTLTVLDEDEAEQKGLGVFAGVAKGSDEPSYIAILEYRANIDSKDVWGLVGKGITFDSGGLYSKPSPAANEMKYDMSGAANVMGVMRSVVELGLKINVVGVMMLTENMSGGKAMRPGDILKSYSGKTIEVIHTDAEGRLVLHDGVALVQKDYGANKIIDLGTLTGAVIVALGDHYTGTFTNNDALAQQLITVGKEQGEKFWQLPMSEEYDEMIPSKFADMGNLGHGGSIGDKSGDSIIAAKIIGQAIEDDHPWIHLDIAGTGWDMSAKPYRGIGATGVGIKTITQLLSRT